MHYFAAKYVKILEICKKFTRNLVNNLGNMPRRDIVPKYFRTRSDSPKHNSWVFELRQWELSLQAYPFWMQGRYSLLDFSQAIQRSSKVCQSTMCPDSGKDSKFHRQRRRVFLHRLQANTSMQDCKKQALPNGKKRYWPSSKFLILRITEHVLLRL